MEGGGAFYIELVGHGMVMHMVICRGCNYQHYIHIRLNHGTSVAHTSKQKWPNHLEDEEGDYDCGKTLSLGLETHCTVGVWEGCEKGGTEKAYLEIENL